MPSMTQAAAEQAQHAHVLVVDFGAQYAQLIARRVREAHVYCEVHPCDVSSDWVREFAADGIRRLAEIAWQVNEKTENIGARRLHTLLERLLEEVSFSAGNKGAESIRIDAQYVDARLTELARNEDLSRYVL